MVSVSLAFLSTPSARRATLLRRRCLQLAPISIHALREEGDFLKIRCVFQNRYFYPRPPRGGRRHPPRRSSRCKLISIHALREEGDKSIPSPTALQKRFLSTPSARRATIFHSSFSIPRFYFYPRPPRGGRPLFSFLRCGSGFNFYPRPPRGGRPPSRMRAAAISHFYPRPPRGGRRVTCAEKKK